jgi:hypothetical protein
MPFLDTTRLINPRSPNLPAAPDVYKAQYHNQLNDLHRLYFNQLDNYISGLQSSAGMRFLRAPYAASHRSTTLTFAAINTPTLVTLDQIDFFNGTTLTTSTDGIHVTQAGIYNYQFSIQFSNSDTSSINSSWVWLRQNGVDVAATSSKFDVISSHAGTPGFMIGAANFFVSMNAGDYVEMWAATNSTQVTYTAAPAQTSPFPMPAIPSVVVTLSFVSALPTTAK